MANKPKFKLLSESFAESSVFHEGELSIQEYLGYRDKRDEGARRAVRDFMPEQHREFFSKLPFMIVGSVDSDGHPWASILVGAPGFVSSPDDRQLEIIAKPLHGDPLQGNLQKGAPVGLLGIEFHTRRRNRLNGIISEMFDGGFRVTVSQSFGNCPKYINERQPVNYGDGEITQSNPPIFCEQSLGPKMQRIVQKADTFFIASAYPGARTDKDRKHGVDVSHRGGESGFVHLENEGQVLVVPDYKGNFFFNTLGNLLLNPQAGLLFIDFDNGDLLYLAVNVDIIWDGPEVAAYEHAQRLLRMQVYKAIRVEGVLPWSWSAAPVFD